MPLTWPLTLLGHEGYIFVAEGPSLSSTSPHSEEFVTSGVLLLIIAYYTVRFFKSFSISPTALALYNTWSSSVSPLVPEPVAGFFLGCISVIDRFCSLISDMVQNMNKRKRRTELPGLLNDKTNSCYMNNVVQGLTSLHSFQSWMQRYLNYNEPEVVQASRALYELMQKLQDHSNKGQSFKVPTILERFEPGEQNDTSEYLIKLVSDIEDEANMVFKKRRMDVGIRDKRLIQSPKLREHQRRTAIKQATLRKKAAGKAAKAADDESSGASNDQLSALAIPTEAASSGVSDTYPPTSVEPAAISNAESRQTSSTEVVAGSDRTPDPPPSQEGQRNDIESPVTPIPHSDADAAPPSSAQMQKNGDESPAVTYAGSEADAKSSAGHAPANPLRGTYAERMGCTGCGATRGISIEGFMVHVLQVRTKKSISLQDLLDKSLEIDTLEGVNCGKCTLLAFWTKTQKGLDQAIAASKESPDDEELHEEARKLQLTMDEVASMLDNEDLDYDRVLDQFKIAKADTVQADMLKQRVIAKAPESLVICLDRTMWDTGMPTKNSVKVEIPHEIDIAPWCLNGTKAGNVEIDDIEGDLPKEFWTMEPSQSMLSPPPPSPVPQHPSTHQSSPPSPSSPNSKEQSRRTSDGSSAPTATSAATWPIGPTPTTYKLRADSVHWGTHDGGHYSIHREDPYGIDEDNWWLFSDDVVKKTNADIAVNPEKTPGWRNLKGKPFLVYYERAGVEKAWINGEPPAKPEPIEAKEVAGDKRTTPSNSTTAKKPVARNPGAEKAQAKKAPAKTAKVQKPKAEPKKKSRSLKSRAQRRKEKALEEE